MPTMGVRVHCTFESKDPKAFLDLAKELTKASRKESGLIQYEFFQEIGQESSKVFHLIGHWESQEALEDHNKTEHKKDFLDKAKSLLAKEPCSQRFMSCGF